MLKSPGESVFKIVCELFPLCFELWLRGADGFSRTSLQNRNSSQCSTVGARDVLDASTQLTSERSRNTKATPRAPTNATDLATKLYSSQLVGATTHFTITRTDRVVHVVRFCICATENSTQQDTARNADEPNATAPQRATPQANETHKQTNKANSCTDRQRHRRSSTVGWVVGWVPFRCCSILLADGWPSSRPFIHLFMHCCWRKPEHFELAVHDV